MIEAARSVWSFALKWIKTAAIIRENIGRGLTRMRADRNGQTISPTCKTLIPFSFFRFFRFV
jgi:hypothetical protein